MGGSSKKQTVGYKYYLGMHMILCRGPVDKLRQVKVDDRMAWQGDFVGGQISINASELFGGESREGGISGAVDFETGHSTQAKNSYLISKLGSLIPAFRGVCGVVLRQCYLGMNPYLKKWSFRVQRVHIRQNGIAQWYDAKAEIKSTDETLVSVSSQFDYVQLAYHDSPGYENLTPPSFGWQSGYGPFGEGSWAWPGQPYPSTNWDQDTILWIRKTIVVPANKFIVARVRAENGCVLFLNEAFLGAANRNNVQLQEGEIFDFTLPAGTYTLYAKAFDEHPTEGATYLSIEIIAFGHSDMNPSHIIRECLTDPDWGMGYQDSDIDDASFTAAANMLYDEGMGMSLLWDKQIAIEEFIKEVVKHIDAALYVDRTTGKFTLKLIRNDFIESELISLNTSNIDKITDFSRPAFGELTNSVTVTFWDSFTSGNSTVTVQDIALAQMQGATIGTTVQYPGFTNKSISTRVAQRDLKTLSTPLASCTIYANRAAAGLNIGDCFKLTWPDYDIENLVMRVTGIAYGDGKSNRVRLTCSQDVYSLPEVAFLAPTPPIWEDPSQAPSAALYRAVVEAPYYELVQRLGQTETDSKLGDNPDICYLLASAAQPSGAINARLKVDSGAGYLPDEDTPLDFCPFAFLSSAVGHTDTIFALTSFGSYEVVKVGSHAQIDDELVKIVAVSSSSITVGRGVIDTVPTAHAANSAILFWDEYADSDEREYVINETLGVKILPTNGAGTLDENSAPEDTLVMQARAFKPFPPGNFKINTVAYPVAIGGSDAASFSWSHRDRLLQTAGELQDTTVGNIGPEAGTTYNLRIYGETNSLIKTVSTSGTSFDYPAIDEKNDSGITIGEDYDAFWTSVVFGMHADGADNGTVFTEVKGKTATPSGNVVTKTSIKKYGTASLYFDGNNDYLTFASHADFGFGTGDFTIEFFVYKAGNSVISIGMGILFDMRSAEPSAFIEMHLRRSDVTDPNKLEVYINGATRIMSSTGFTTSFNHVALERKAGVTKLFVNGVNEGSSYTDANNYATSGLVIGGRFAAVSGDYRSHNGYIDEIRITKGVARYDGSNFTPPQKAFPESDVAEFRLNGRLRIELESSRSSVISLQKHNYTVLREGYGYNYGELYGGDA